MTSSDEAPRGLKMEKLTKNNHETWFAKIEDYICALDHDDAAGIWEAYRWGEYGTAPAVDGNGAQEPDPADHDYQAANTAATKKLRRIHNVAWEYIRRHLSDTIFQTTLRLGHKSVPKLLRHLRKNWHDNSSNDRSILRKQYLGMQLEDHQDMDVYIQAYKNMVSLLREYDIGTAQRDEDVLDHFEKSLGAGWKDKVTIRMATGMQLQPSYTFYKNLALQDSTLPGAIKKHGSTKTMDSAHTTQEVCRKFTQGKCFKKNCKYLHPTGITPTGAPNRPSPKKFEGTCFHCGIKGHRISDCRKKARGEPRTAPATAQDTTRVTDDSQGKNQDEIRIDSMVYAAYEEVSLTGLKAARSGLGKGKKLLLEGSGSTSTCVDVVESEH